jgi:guanosine-3',5'-bis(diphosphate) 3'-pyrophosphohydrolase
MKQEKTFEDLIERVTQYLPPKEIETIHKAYHFAKTCHDGQLRKSGDPYISHPVEVANILADLEQDTAAICAGLLHDTLEDCHITHGQLAEKFGEEVALLVEGVTKLGKLTFQSQEEAQAENFRKMFLAMAKDLRVVIIKLADRLHNMRTLKYMPKQKQLDKARETRDIFSPLAHRLGMWKVKWELEDLTFFYLQYDEFQEIKRLVASRREERERYVHQFLEHIDELLKTSNISARVTGRPKHFYSIYKKIVSQDLSFDALYDTLGVRIIVKDLTACYTVLGVVHSAFKPINGRFKDYIAMPKSNMYQSLHTTVMGPEGKPVEVQIRTEEMDQIAEYGIAAHWRYKEGARGKFDGDFTWIRQLIDQHRDTKAPTEFLHDLTGDLFVDEVFVFTPKGEVQVLPHGSTPIDFAYKIHTEIGHRCKGAKVNGMIVNLDYVLQSGDRIEVLTSKKPNPKLDWLLFVNTGQARNRIKQWVKRQNAEDNIQNGKIKLDKLLLVAGFLPKEVFTPSLTHDVCKQFEVGELDDLYLLIAQGEVSPKAVSDYIQDLLNPSEKEPEQFITAPSSKLSKTSLGDVKVLGENNVMAYLAKCCHPLPGDSIIGFITLGYGVSIHRQDCSQLSHLDESGKARLVQAEWNSVLNSSKTYRAILHVEAFDRIGVLKDVLNIISDTKTNISEVKTKSQAARGKMRASITLEIKDIKHLNKVKQAIASIDDVLSIKRGKTISA